MNLSTDIILLSAFFRRRDEPERPSKMAVGVRGTSNVGGTVVK
jgi:hypothetical protein